jgi:ATP-dependent 26S proteasome regulatory subunit
MNKINPPDNYPLYESSYGADIPFQQLYILKFNLLPSKLTSKAYYNFDIIDKFKSLGFVEILRSQNLKDLRVARLSKTNSITVNILSDYILDERMFINENKKIILNVRIKNDSNKNCKNVSIDYLYDLNDGEIYNQLPFEEFISYEIINTKANIGLIRSDMGHLDVEEFELNIPNIDLKLNYGAEFIKVHDLIVKRLNQKNDKGIILLHGDPGTGKTSYIKYLTKLIEDKEILFIPPSMAEVLSEPTIIPFLMEHRNSILIIEDAERVISDREINGSSIGVSNILNLTDGILGDCLNIQIIATFNMKKEKIDTALLRKGRLIAEHKFKPLSIEDTNNLIKFLDKNYESDTEMCLADIYNIDVESYKVENKNKKIGFK